ncbi:RNA polymerase sigma factor [Panacibacter sp. DH6]|uniref:RNA polymerase sigma factor n=1 Tax=Panacibacter microcysteis TaxID=2793269 RepID=A0A931E7H7_9BACT|nr:RNA polymerase sigma factor [Panacibacter microcysteis]MBG9377612.1 RNA polymerase sigma factor [Panacibacter microcysteis]
MTQEELQVILEDCRQNRRTAQEKLYRFYYADMFRLAQRYSCDHHVALTIVNDAFLKAFKHIALYRENLGQFKSWLKTIVINTAIDHLRSTKKDIRLVHIDQIQEQGDEDFALQHRWKHEELMRHLQALPTITRTVVNLFAFDGFSHKEIALHLDITETTSRWHLSEARKRLRESLQITSPQKTYKI